MLGMLGMIEGCGQRVAPFPPLGNRFTPSRFPAGLRTTFFDGVPMSVSAMSWAFNLELKDPLAKCVLLALADHYSDQNRCCWPSVQRLMLFTGQSESRVHKSIRLLIKLGHVSRELRTNQSSLFYLKMEGCPIDTPRVPNGHRGGVQRAPARVPNEHPNHNHGTVREPSENRKAHERGASRDVSDARAALKEAFKGLAKQSVRRMQ